jgi:hypothetical protein
VLAQWRRHRFGILRDFPAHTRHTLLGADQSD